MKASNDIYNTCYKFYMQQKGGGMFCHGVEGQEEKEEDDSDLDLDYKDNYDHWDDWEREELLSDKED